MLLRSIVVFSLSLFAFVGCSKDTGTKPAEKAAQTEKGHAAVGVKPGSHEDWCEEHQVPESQCTQCNPDLIPAFKASKDWCPEHGLPESQCKICNPEVVIARPPKGK